MRRAIAALALTLAVWVLPARAQEKIAAAETRQFEDPGLLSFDELVALSSTARREGQLAARLDTVLAFAPHFPQIMRQLNQSVRDCISDHPPTG